MSEFKPKYRCSESKEYFCWFHVDDLCLYTNYCESQRELEK